MINPILNIFHLASQHSFVKIKTNKNLSVLLLIKVYYPLCYLWSEKKPSKELTHEICVHVSPFFFFFLRLWQGNFKNWKVTDEASSASTLKIQRKMKMWLFWNLKFLQFTWRTLMSLIIFFFIKYDLFSGLK